ncbi:MAG: HEAT repeat protein [Planctomycetota bacterium]|jgi:HEAT repeat protein
MRAINVLLVGLLAGPAFAVEGQPLAAYQAVEIEIEQIVERWRALPTQDPKVLTKELVKIGGRAEPYLCQLLNGAGREDLIVPVITTLGEVATTIRSVQVIGGLLDSKEDKHRVSCVNALGRQGTPEAVPFVLVALDDQAKVVRASAAVVLEDLVRKKPKLRMVRRLRKVQRTLKHPDQFALLLGRLGTKDTREMLCGLLSFGHTEGERLAGLSGLWIGGKPGDGADVRQLLNSQPSIPVRRKACLVLGNLGDKQAIRDLIDNLHSDNAGLVSDAHWALRRLTKLRLPPNTDLWEAWWDRVGSKAKPISVFLTLASPDQLGPSAPMNPEDWR